MNKKCAIYNRYSIKDEKKLKEYREKLIHYCVNVLKIKDYEVFEDCGSIKDERKDFDRMINLINNKEFTDLLSYHIDRIYKPRYDEAKFREIIDNIKSCNVEIHEMVN